MKKEHESSREDPEKVPGTVSFLWLNWRKLWQMLILIIPEKTIRKQKIHAWLHDELLLRLGQRILLLDVPVLLRWGQLMAKLELSGQKMPSIDSFIAATAIQNDLTLVTRNVVDFKNLEMKIINPWE